MRTIAIFALLLLFTPHAAAQFAISPDGKRSATGVGNGIKIDDVATQKELIRIQGHSQRVTTLAYTPDGRLLLSGSLDQTVKIWEAATGRQLRAFAVGAAVSTIDTNGKTVTVIDDKKNKREYDIETGQPVMR